MLTNPPFRKDIQSVSATTRLGFAPGRKWRRGKAGEYVRGHLPAEEAPPQVLLMERIIPLLRRGGRAGVVVSESLLDSRSYGHVVQHGIAGGSAGETGRRSG